MGCRVEFDEPLCAPRVGAATTARGCAVGESGYGKPSDIGLLDCLRTLWVQWRYVLVSGDGVTRARVIGILLLSGRTRSLVLLAADPFSV